MDNLDKRLIVKKGALSVESIVHSPFLDVNIEYPTGNFCFFAKYDVHLHYATIQDIRGNGFYSGFQGKGVGTLLVNTAILNLQLLLPPTARIDGQMSYVDDPEEPVQKQQCRMIRCGFWRSFGFEILPGEWGAQKFVAKLCDIKLKPSGFVFGKYPRLIALQEFSDGSKKLSSSA